MTFVQVKKCLSDPKQVIRLVLLVICVCLSLYQLSGCVRKLVHPPVSSHYTFHLNETIKYPSVTICRRPAYKRYLFQAYGIRSSTSSLTTRDVFKFFPFNTTTIEEFLNVTTYKINELIPMYGFNGDGNQDNIDIQSFYLLEEGRCQTITPKENANTFTVQLGYFFYLKHTTKQKVKDDNGEATSGFEIFIHPENEVLTEERNDLMKYLYVESAEELHVTLSVQTVSQISTSYQPCVSDPGYTRSKCVETCFHNFVARTVGCTLPWLRNLDKEYPPCSDFDSVASLISTYKNEVWRKRELKRCNCVNACNNTIYSYHIQSRRDADSITAPSSTLVLYFSTNLISTLSEVISYDWNVFLSDVGGSLGFLLGLSVIGVLTLVEEAIKLLFGCGEKQKEEKEELKTVVDLMMKNENITKY